MDFYFTYQLADTVKSKSLLDLHSKAIQPAVLNIDRSATSTLDFQAERAQAVEIQPTPRKISAAQIRYYQNREEEKLLVNGSRTIAPIEKYDFGQTQLIARDIVLPERIHNQANYDWVAIVLAFSLFIFATVRIPYAKYIGHMFQSLFNYPAATRLFRERNYSLVHGAFRLDVYFYFIFSMFVFLTIKYYSSDLPFPDIVLYLLCILAVLLYFSIKKLLYVITGAVSNGQALTSEYWFNVNNYNRALGLFLSPVVAIVAFSPALNPFYFIVSGFFFTVFFYGMSLQRGILILLKKQFSIFYLFLYLCTLEILPLVLIFKMVIA